jgi:hypothetical protein
MIISLANSYTSRVSETRCLLSFVFTSGCSATDPNNPLLRSRLFESSAISQLTLASNFVQVTLRLTFSQSVSLGVEPYLGLVSKYLLLFDSYGLVLVGRPVWLDSGSVVFICCWPLPAQFSRVRFPWNSRPYFTLSD